MAQTQRKQSLELSPSLSNTTATDELVSCPFRGFLTFKCVAVEQHTAQKHLDNKILVWRSTTLRLLTFRCILYTDNKGV